MSIDGRAVDAGLRRKVRIYLAIFAIAVAVVVVDLVRVGAQAWWPVVACTLVGLALGVVASRMSRLSWDAATSTVVGRVDGLGAVILAGYVLLVVLRGRLVASWFDPAVVGVAGVAMLAGLMLGQVMGTVGGIVRIAGIARRPVHRAEPAQGK